MPSLENIPSPKPTGGACGQHRGCAGGGEAAEAPGGHLTAPEGEMPPQAGRTRSRTRAICLAGPAQRCRRWPNAGSSGRRIAARRTNAPNETNIYALAHSSVRKQTCDVNWRQRAQATKTKPFLAIMLAQTARNEHTATHTSTSKSVKAIFPVVSMIPIACRTRSTSGTSSASTRVCTICNSHCAREFVPSER